MSAFPVQVPATPNSAHSNPFATADENPSEKHSSLQKNTIASFRRSTRVHQKTPASHFAQRTSLKGHLTRGRPNRKAVRLSCCSDFGKPIPPIPPNSTSLYREREISIYPIIQSAISAQVPNFTQIHPKPNSTLSS